MDRIAQKKKLDGRAALEQIAALDAGRRAYVKRHFSADVTNATDYDLLINTTHQSLDDLARMLAARLRPAPAQAGIR